MTSDQMMLFGGVLGLAFLRQYVLACIWLLVFVLGVVDDIHKPHALVLFFFVSIWSKFYKAASK